ncbi:MAG: type I restriction enzyme HsdR N-terminal domain-containing protein [Bacillota bacterium]|nr:type I restriction enzyme HsdR N-terminal domain-containing protein [Bacillota bacterium]
MMINIPAKTKANLASGIKRFQPILAKARAADINESDTVTIIVDILSEVFGYDKYTEITSEFAVKRTYCDLAIKLDGVVSFLIEIKAAGLSLKENYIKQAIDYSANSGVEWVILTNGLDWNVYKIIFSKPINAELVYSFDLTKINPKKDADLELPYYLTKHAMSKQSKASLEDYRAQKQIVNRVTIGQILLSEPVLDTIRKTIRKMADDVKITNDEISQILTDEVIKRDVIDDDRSMEAKKSINKALKQVKTQKHSEQSAED